MLNRSASRFRESRCLFDRNFKSFSIAKRIAPTAESHSNEESLCDFYDRYHSNELYVESYRDCFLQGVKCLSQRVQRRIHDFDIRFQALGRWKSLQVSRSSVKRD